MPPLERSCHAFLGLGVFAVSIVLHAKELDGVRAAATNACPSVEEARAKMIVPAGYEVRAFAAEPDVVNPVAMDFDARGRLWVAELYEYPSGSKTPSPFAAKVSDQAYRPVPAATAGLPRDRIVILEDTDNDGRADKRTVFLEGLNLASGLCVADGGVYVGQSPHLLHFRDTDGDDHADQWKVVLTGFGRQDTHELLNSFQIGPDGALFFTQGVFTTSQVRRPQDPETAAHKMDTGLGRVVIDRSQLAAEGPFGTFELFADGLSNCWGFDYDAAGNYFAEACVIDHLFHVAPGGVYQRQAGAPGNPHAYDLLPSIVDYKHFRAAYAGLTVYQGGVYPADTDGHIFLGNIHANAIHEERVEPRGASFKAFPVRDFLTANDGWFRPVQIRTGPDGFLWVMDWCDKYPCYQNAQANPEGVDRQRGRIWRVCHTGTEVGKKLAGQSRATKDLDLAKASSETLLNSLADNNNWTRRTARRLLVERMASEPGKLVEALQAKVLESKNTSERHESLWVLAGARTGPKWSDYFGYRVVTHEDPVIRGWAFRTKEEFADETFELWTNFKYENDPWVLSQQLYALTSWFKIGMERILEEYDKVGRIDRKHEKPAKPSDWLWQERYDNYIDPIVQGWIGRSFVESHSDGRDTLLNFQAWLLIEPSCGRGGAWHDATRGYFGQGNLPRIIARKAARRSVEFDAMNVAGFYWNAYYCILSEENFTATLEGFLEGPTPQRGSEEAKKLRDAYFNFGLRVEQQGEYGPFKNEKDRARARDLYAKLETKWFGVTNLKQIAVLKDPKAPLSEKISSLRNMAENDSLLLEEHIAYVLAHQAGEDWDFECVRALRFIKPEKAFEGLVQLWHKTTPPVRNAIGDAFASKESLAELLIIALNPDLYGTGFGQLAPIKLSELSPTLRRKLLTAVDPKIRTTDPKRMEASIFAQSNHGGVKEDFYAAAQKLLGTFNDTAEELRKLITTKRSAMLAGTPDLAKGKQTFEAMCSVCHEFQGVGKKVGPDLNGSGRANLDNLLHNVIAPNEVIGAGYENWRLTTKDGRTATGRLVEKTDRHVRLLGPGGIEETVAAEQVEKLENSGESLMPVGFGQLPDDTLRDLVWYLLAPPAEGALTPEKKAKLAESND